MDFIGQEERHSPDPYASDFYAAVAQIVAIFRQTFDFRTVQAIVVIAGDKDLCL